MQTDIPLKRLTTLRARDLLPLLNVADVQVEAVESLELPATATRLDNLLRLSHPDGREHLHIIEWQGYHDPAVLWRFAGYLAWLSQRRPNIPIVGTVIYLTPEADVGHVLRQSVDGRDVIVWPVPIVRLWELDAGDAVRQGGLGIAVLSPLMQGATIPLVEQVIAQVLDQAPMTQQADLLSILGVFAEPLIAPDRFIRLVGKEKLMASDLISYLFKDQIAETEQRVQRAIVEMQQAVADVVILRFPNIPAVLVQNIQSVTDLDQLAALHRTVVRVPDQAAAEALLAAIPAAVASS